MEDSKVLLGLLAVAGVGVGIYFLVRKPEVGAKWQVGDEILCYIKNTVWRWAPFTILDVREYDGVLSYYVGEGHPRNIIDYNWVPVSEVDKLNCRRA